jgi:hypothetical protein|tara:strand:- start:1432 stop:2151 length:720 start_codon:yes stop_codon:yes gene_type:complete
VKKLISAYVALVLSTGVMADSSDNEIFLEQSGDTLTLTIDQVGYGNKFGGTIVGGSVATDMIITGHTIVFNLDQLGNSNQLFGPIILDSSNIDMSFTGDSNIFDWNAGYIGSADSLDLDLTVTGDSNTWDFDLGYVATAERLDYDLVLIGSTNVFTTVVDSSDTKWELSLTGAGNDYNTTQKDADQILIVDYTGDDGNVDILQSSGTCTGVITSCSGTINLEVTSDDAVITINQKDTAD